MRSGRAKSVKANRVPYSSVNDGDHVHGYTRGREMKADATLDLLLDLKHDLGKYLLLPIGLLPKDAGEPELRDALRRALLQTRVSRGQSQSARELWQAFAAELGSELAGSAALAQLRAAVERALAWERALAPEVALERALLERDLQAVQAAIAALIAEVRRG